MASSSSRRLVAGWVGALLWLVAVVLLVMPTTVTFSVTGASDYKTSCEPVLAPVLPFLQAGESGPKSAGVRDTGQAKFELAVAGCAANRDTSVAGSTLLIGIGTILGVVALTRRRTVEAA